MVSRECSEISREHSRVKREYSGIGRGNLIRTARGLLKYQEDLFMKIGTQELLIVLVIAILIFGPTQIPKLSKIVGKSIKNFRSGMSDGEEEKDSAEQ